MNRNNILLLSQWYRKTFAFLDVLYQEFPNYRSEIRLVKHNVKVAKEVNPYLGLIAFNDLFSPFYDRIREKDEDFVKDIYLPEGYERYNGKLEEIKLIWKAIPNKDYYFKFLREQLDLAFEYLSVRGHDTAAQ